MNQEKIGKFILKLRKDKKMTQQELADKLNVTDRAVSHWENGRSIPDVALFKPICEIFGISVNELISGEKLSKEKLIKQSDENIINTLKDSDKHKRKSKSIIVILTIGIVILLIAILIGIKNKYPKIDLFNFTIQQADPEKPYKLEKQITINNRTIYYYGIDFAFFCDKNEKCYQIVDALKHNQITIDEFHSYLNKQVEYDNYKSISMWDGGTTIYKKSGKEIIFCNTLEGNKDIYIGSEKMEEELKGNYCGHESNQEKTFIRTYYIISAVDDNEEDYIDVTLRQFQGTPEIVKIDKSANIVVGRNYEFTFRTYIKYDDTTKNIFENSTILKIEETNKTGLEQINQAINVNDK
ncbi:MAG: helix-turn-helix transcriptional regulator [Bacilli bacterium]|nr:helix-turn-helix transcriptional regulator [Bacilli bacterium]MBP3259444.1 helix-turn-helix transcriptional regulator [Bacilli bacterium]